MEHVVAEELEPSDIDGFDAVGLWGLLGLSALLGSSVYRVSLVALGAWGQDVVPLQAHHWIFLAVWVAFMGYTEGYRGFQLGYSRRVVRRALSLKQEERLLPRLLAPLTCMGIIYASRRRLVSAWSIIVAVVGMVSLVRLFPQPWRGLVDAGVVVGLGWGLLSMWSNMARVLAGGVVPAPVRRPES